MRFYVNYQFIELFIDILIFFNIQLKISLKIKGFVSNVNRNFKIYNVLQLLKQ